MSTGCRALGIVPEFPKEAVSGGSWPPPPASHLAKTGSSALLFGFVSFKKKKERKSLFKPVELFEEGKDTLA